MSTLNGFALSYKDWTVQVINKDTVLYCSLPKTSLLNLREYVVGLEQYKTKCYVYEQVIDNKDKIISNLKITLDNYKEINKLEKEKTDSYKKWMEDETKKYNKCKKLTPYFISGGFILGVLSCLLVR